MTFNKRNLTAYLFSVLLFFTAPSALLAEGDPVKGAKVYKKCAACHSLDAGKNRVGPSLYNIYGAPAGQVEGFKRYSKGLLSSGVTWDDASLDAYVESPRKFIKGGKMPFPGLKKPQDRADLIAYLKEQTAAE